MKATLRERLIAAGAIVEHGSAPPAVTPRSIPVEAAKPAKPVEAIRPTLLLYRCQRCDSLHEEAHPDAEVALRRAVEAGQFYTVHSCQDGASGCCRLIGTGPGAPRQETTQ